MKSEINKYGQFFTKKEMCKSILEIVNNIKPLIGNALEPSFGCGNFIDEINNYNLNIDGVEIDKKYFDNYKNIKSNLLNIDFLDFETNKQYDFIIGNPPYIEICYSFYNKEQQDLIKKKYKNICSGRINLVHIFINNSIKLLKDDGIIAFLLPSSILTSPTYKEIRKLIFEQFSIEYLKEDVKFQDVAIKVSLLIIRKNKTHNKYFYLNNDNYFITENYKQFSNTKTLKEIGFNVSIGEIVWNQHKERLTNNTDEKMLLYSTNIDVDNLSLINNRDRKQYIINQEVKYNNCIIFPRTISKKLKYFFVKNNTNYIFENHVLVLTHDDINMLEIFYNNIKNGKYDDTIFSFFNSSNLTKTEFLSLPFYF